jgi:hypothetical protein
LLAFLVLDSASEVLPQREGGAFWGPFAHGRSHGTNDREGAGQESRV